MEVSKKVTDKLDEVRKALRDRQGGYADSEGKRVLVNLLHELIRLSPNHYSYVIDHLEDAQDLADWLYSARKHNNRPGGAPAIRTEISEKLDLFLQALRSAPEADGM